MPEGFLLIVYTISIHFGLYFGGKTVIDQIFQERNVVDIWTFLRRHGTTTVLSEGVLDQTGPQWSKKSRFGQNHATPNQIS